MRQKRATHTWKMRDWFGLLTGRGVVWFSALLCASLRFSYWHVQNPNILSVCLPRSVPLSPPLSLSDFVDCLCRLPSLSARLLCVSVILFSRQTKNTNTYQNVENVWQDCQAVPPSPPPLTFPTAPSPSVAVVLPRRLAGNWIYICAYMNCLARFA